MISIKNNLKIDSILTTNIIFALFPLSFILGNFAISLNLILFCLLGIFHIRSKNLSINYNFSIKIIFLFFILVFFSTSIIFLKFLYIDGYKYENLVPLIKSITLFRFFLMLVIACFLIENDILDLNYFFISAAFFPAFIASDIIFQYIFGFNIVGLESFRDHHIPPGKYFSSFFGDELIAGSYIRSFTFFSILFLIYKLKSNQLNKFIFTIILICLLGLAVFISGNRMPLLLFILTLFLTFFFAPKMKSIVLTSIFILYAIFYFMFSVDIIKKKQFLSLGGSVRNNIIVIKDSLMSNSEKNVAEVVNNKKTNEKPLTDFDDFWLRKHGEDSFGQLERDIYMTALDIWEKNIIFGNGIRAFRRDCHKLLEYRKNRICSNHPHNYYMEILVDTGIAGLFIVLIIAISFLIFIFKNYKLLLVNNRNNLILLAATLSLAVEMFPLRSSGSIFTTHNATYIIILASIILSRKKLLSQK